MSAEDGNTTDLLSWHICCLIEAKVWNGAEKLLKLVQSASYYLLLLIHMETNYTIGENLSVL